MDRRFLLTFAFCSFSWILFWEVRWKKGKEGQIEEWLQEHGLAEYRHLFEDVHTLEELSLHVLARLEEVEKERQRWPDIAEAQIQLLRDFAFQEWLCYQSLEHYYHTLKTLGCTNLDDLAKFDSRLQLSLAAWGYYYEDYIKLSSGVKVLQASKGHRDQDYEIQLVHSLAERRLTEKWSIAGALIFGCTIALCFLIRDLMFYVIGGITVSIIAFVFTIKFLCELAARVVSFLQNEDRGRRGDRSIYDYVRGNYLDPRSCKVSWDWKDPQEVGQTMTFRVQLFYKNGQPFPAHRPVGLRVSITHIELALDIPVTQEVLQEPEANVVKVAFTVRKAGRYEVAVKLGGLNVAYSPYYKIFQPGVVVPSKTKIACHFSTLVLTHGQQHTLQIEPRDEYGNPTSNSTSLADEDSYGASVQPLGTQDEDSPEDFFSKSVSSNRLQCQVQLHLTVRRKGCFHARITYQNQLLSNGEFDIIVLSENEKNCVEKYVSTPGTSVYFEAYLYSTGNYSTSTWQLPVSSLLVPQRRLSTADEEDDRDSPVEGQPEKVKKPKKVYCYISPKQLSVKEFYLKIFPWRLFTFRVCPGTKFTYHGPDPIHKYLTLVVDDGIQPPVELSCKDRNIMAATFIRFLHKNIGGSETFQDKVNFFQRELRHIHSKRPRTKTCLKVARHVLLDSSLKATRNFSVSDWSKNFEVVFQDEEALDWGGPRREWFELICKTLFDTSNQLFTRFSDSNQGLVHPNAERPAHLRLKVYEFAGRVVGKCLYESALGGAYKQLVRARFTRSFLAQIIGLRMNYKYFETDDEEFYKTKVSFILNNDVSEMDLVFAEEKYNKSGQLEKVVELISGGAQIAVTNENKMHYLNLLAQHRLANQVRDEVEHFLKGLNELVPENLLAIFDENELELLMCGTGDISVQDFKAHAVIVGGSWHFREKVMKWFWAVVSSFTQEELARLLQFTTGSSQLPPGGFNTLCPSFQIIAAPTHSTLPTAHTCFNQLCLPTYDSYEELHKMVKLAISEGSEGFGML
ncbi:apoptosis-resistant E3 ubiquitin protein ligase 1 isoform X1 [Brienomyrus brachyistius]|uniref:apoptosis-resistant E3 ubiquitin protein ligase 1 isoform X1 n=2 Tax=Brienomyrus brachyistius TaxID=42636 RepID=UPI0020B1C299|nr:apoptosis-resistant E3 ubiquitin protein ligase 1 isoform X1 [Brienomyrus brachyistius]XP_048830644.1 apoptosis-resistant E3 ubiquitin protein ligase 1 isoform X1 [Brienomyrus brachyistius]XP_048830645.1 apoptosis-resistant E3 ubiquitin protein ligase 1 isoform X1 [Brienomyrus brachyistius]XP_048830646.1 apoptosis-resistant E3 ubiquitin protein ligase 1 isoform X1 [Brienomyrus brachyistius]XP_048830647.1 apoptosis-resistant E3 ubiquitin protein ligase 1 isoform X1 [Brienomyrus brachyistius]